MRCIKCGIPLLNGEDSCPSCKTPITETIQYYESQGYEEDKDDKLDKNKKLIPESCKCCCHFNREDLECKRIGECGDNKGKEGICWMDSGEGEY